MRKNKTNLKSDLMSTKFAIPSLGVYDADKALAATKPKASAAYFGAPQTMADGSGSPVRSSSMSKAEIKNMSIEEKMELLMQLRQGNNNLTNINSGF